MKILFMVLVLMLSTSQWARAPHSLRRVFYLANAGLTPRQTVVKVAIAAGIDKRVLLAIWDMESRQQSWAPRGAAGEYGPFQILPATGARFCKGLRWRANFLHNAKCGARWIRYGKKRCRIGLPWQIGEWYNRGRCIWKNPSRYARLVDARV